MLATFLDATPIRFDEEQINISVYPSAERHKIRKVLREFYTRPQLVLDSTGSIKGYEGVDKSYKAFAEVLHPDDEVARLQAYENARDTPGLQAALQAEAASAWNCWAPGWSDFEVPMNQSRSYASAMYIGKDATEVAATSEHTNHGFISRSTTLLDLEMTTKASGSELAQVFLELTYKANGVTGELPDIDNTVSVTRANSGRVHMDPETSKAVWAKCTSTLVVDSKDPSILPPVNYNQEAEFDIQWLN